MFGLHAAELTFRHPKSAKLMTLSAPMPSIWREQYPGSMWSDFGAFVNSRDLRPRLSDVVASRSWTCVPGYQMSSLRDCGNAGVFSLPGTCVPGYQMSSLRDWGTRGVFSSWDCVPGYQMSSLRDWGTRGVFSFWDLRPRLSDVVASRLGNARGDLRPRLLSPRLGFIEHSLVD